LRILFLSDNYWPTVGGAETYVRELGRGLVARGHDVLVYTDGPRHSTGVAATRENGILVVRDSSYWSTLEREGGAWEHLAFGRLETLAVVANDFMPDVIHANNHDTAILGSILKLQLGKPLVATAHEVGRETRPLGVGRVSFVSRCLPVDVTLAVSDFYLAQAKLYGAPNVEKVYVGVDTEKFSPASGPERAPNVTGSNLVVCLARFKARKGLADLIRAAHLVVNQSPDAHFLLAGSSSSASSTYAEHIRCLISDLGLDDNFRIIYDLNHDRVPQLLHTCDIVVQPSHSEGLGLAAIEAMACGLPVIASNTTGLAEVVQDGVTGILIPPGEPTALAAAISSLLADPVKRAQMGLLGRERALQVFSFDHMLTCMESIYQRLVEDNVAPLANSMPQSTDANSSRGAVR
jgi:glycosyltransferase involved in cell wall biosynthesis